MASFAGGVHPPYRKLSASSPIEAAPRPSIVILPLSQHTGAPAKPLVAKGDAVRMGQPVAEAGGFVSAAVHASVSGTVREVSLQPHPVQGRSRAVVIEPAERDEPVEARPRGDPDKLSPDDIRAAVREAGVVGLGGAAFPTAVKLSPPKDKPIDSVFLNGAECEPYLTCDHRLMVEETSKVLEGLALVKRAVGASRAYICIEENKPDALEAFTDLLEERGDLEGFSVVPLEPKYPQGGEKMLIYAACGRRVPAGGLPLDVGCVVSNVGTCKAVRDAVHEGLPLVERVVTVTGAVRTPKNLRVRLGTPASELVAACGGAVGPVRRVVCGGPMMGVAEPSLSFPIVKGSSGVLVQVGSDVERLEAGDCIRCGRCVEACPMDLVPTQIAQLAKRRLFERAGEAHAMDCFECGSCAYSCPARIPLVHWIRYAKNRIAAAGRR